MRLRSKTYGHARELVTPAPPHEPPFPSYDLAGLYLDSSAGGDFFEVIRAGERIVFVLLDIAGRRDPTLEIAVRESLRSVVPNMFGNTDLNEADAITDLVHHLNLGILEAAGGVRCAAAFVGCYNDSHGFLTYINAGHVPALVRHHDNVSALESSGLPLGLFSHVTHDAQVSVIPEGAALLLGSRGLLEVTAEGEEFGLERLKSALKESESHNAHQLCSTILTAVRKFAVRRRRFFRLPLWGKDESLPENDITVVALIRHKARALAAATS